MVLGSARSAGGSPRNIQGRAPSTFCRRGRNPRGAGNSTGTGEACMKVRASDRTRARKWQEASSVTHSAVSGKALVLPWGSGCWLCRPSELLGGVAKSATRWTSRWDLELSNWLSLKHPGLQRRGSRTLLQVMAWHVLSPCYVPERGGKGSRHL